MKQVFFLLVIGAGVGYFFTAHNDILFALAQKYSPVKLPVISKSVQGASTVVLPKVIQQELAKLSPSDIASASPQMKTLINLLQKLPKGQVQTVCENVCKGIK